MGGNSKTHTKNKSKQYHEIVFDPWTHGLIDNDINTKSVRTINIKDRYYQPEVFESVKTQVEEIYKGNIDVVIFIHGYGSHGTQAKIHDWCRNALQHLKEKYSNIVVVNGEDCNIFNMDALKIKQKYHELELMFQVCNHGATIIYKK